MKQPAVIRRTTGAEAKLAGGQGEALGSPLSNEDLAQVAGGITAKMPPLYYGDATYGDMRLIPKTPLVSK